MKLGEVCISTNDVVRLANFYKWLLQVDNNSKDEIHQTIVKEEPMLTIFHDGFAKQGHVQTMSIAFTVENVDREYERLVKHGVDIVAQPETRPWGAKNLSFRDPDGNVVYLRQFI